MLSVTDVRKTFFAGTVNERVALNGVSLTVNEGDFVTVIGSNGAGKSTLLNTVSGTIIPDSGEIRVRERVVTRLPEHRKARRPHRARKRKKPKFDRDVSILFRPDDVSHRRQFGHWEADLVVFKQRFGQSNVTSLVERVSRFTVLLKNPNKRTKP